MQIFWELYSIFHFPHTFTVIFTMFALTKASETFLLYQYNVMYYMYIM